MSDREIEEIIDYGKSINVLQSDIDTLKALLDCCKELPDQQWQTIDEFKANPVDDWVHICFGEERNVDTAYYRDGGFWWSDMSYGGDNWNDVEITHVMPIKTPEAPK